MIITSLKQNWIKVSMLNIKKGSIQKLAVMQVLDAKQASVDNN